MNAESEKSVNQLRKILDEDDRMRKYIRPKEGIKIYSLSRTFFDEIAKKAGAMYKIGKVILVEVEPFEEYLRQHRVEPDDETTVDEEEDEK